MVDQSATLEDPNNLRHHYRIGATELGQLLLGDLSVRAQPGDGSDKYELHVGQVEGRQSAPLCCLPAVRHLPSGNPVLSVASVNPGPSRLLLLAPFGRH